MKASWVTFTDKNYEPLALVLIDGLSAFSTRGIEVFGLDYFPRINLPWVTCRKIAREPDDKFWPYSAKIKAAVQSSCDVGVLFDADIVPNVHCDELMEFAVKNREIEYPLCSAHPRDPKHQSEFMQILGVQEQSMDYVQANFLFSAASKPFLADVLSAMDVISEKTGAMFNYDETLLNVMLWKIGATKQLHPFIPTAENFEEYWTTPETYQDWYYGEKYPTFHAFHGEKDPEVARRMLDRISTQKRTPDMDGIRYRNPEFL